MNPNAKTTEYKGRRLVCPDCGSEDLVVGEYDWTTCLCCGWDGPAEDAFYDYNPWPDKPEKEWEGA